MNEKYILELSKKLKTLDESEKRKLEFKSKWYDLKVKRDIEEFVLDVTAMANTPGPVGYIIIGMREDGTLTDSPISNSNLKDESYIQHLVTKKVNLGVQFNIETFEVQNKTISVVVIPPSLDKPHVIKNYIKYDKHNKKISERDNYIPVRHGTTVGPANKTDIEYMYYDRKNIVPDYKLAFLPIEQKPIINQKSKRNDTWLTITKRFIVQNIGRYPVAISKAHLKLENLKPSISIPEKVFTNTGDAWVRVHKDRLNTINNSLLKVL